MRLPAPPEQAGAAREAAGRILERLGPWDTGALLPGFLFDHDSAPERVRRAYGEADYRRPAELKAEYDPHQLFRVNHNIPPAGDGEPVRP
ncbi:BBE domain-containing protein [Streptomyces cinereospinus]|uniref:BBE domain-containing protein n=1 Tax=Streptomyces cinereospinus TaxID=285561 RepID=A0ABV5N9M3_9ACTN